MNCGRNTRSGAMRNLRRLWCWVVGHDLRGTYSVQITESTKMPDGSWLDFAHPRESGKLCIRCCSKVRSRCGKPLEKSRP